VCLCVCVCVLCVCVCSIVCDCVCVCVCQISSILFSHPRWKRYAFFRVTPPRQTHCKFRLFFVNVKFCGGAIINYKSTMSPSRREIVCFQATPHAHTHTHTHTHTQTHSTVPQVPQPPQPHILHVCVCVCVCVCVKERCERACVGDGCVCMTVCYVHAGVYVWVNVA